MFQQAVVGARQDLNDLFVRNKIIVERGQLTEAVAIIPFIYGITDLNVSLRWSCDLLALMLELVRFRYWLKCR